MNISCRRRTAFWAVFVTVVLYSLVSAILAIVLPMTHSGTKSGGIHPFAFGWFASNVVIAQDAPRPAPNDTPTTGDSTKSVQKLLDDQVAAWNKGDLEGFMAGYWNSPELSFYSGRDTRKGWKETHDRYEARYKKDGREMGKLTFGELAFDALTAETVIVKGRWKLVLSKESPDGLFTLIVQKKSEGWRIVHDHTSVGETEKKP